jgi:hypothetical protein
MLSLESPDEKEIEEEWLAEAQRRARLSRALVQIRSVDLRGLAYR